VCSCDLEISEIPVIKVDKVDDESDASDAPQLAYDGEISINQREIYNKMSVQELKKVVITKGFSSDSSKLKKADLLKLLEQES